MSKHFEDATKPRIIKRVAAEVWNGGVMQGSPPDVSHCFKVVKIESHEDTLNNLQRRRQAESAEDL